MRILVVLASLCVSQVAVSADTTSRTNEYYAGYSIERIEGAMPIRTVVVKYAGSAFTSYSGFQFDCDSPAYSQTGFYSSVGSVIEQLQRSGRTIVNYSYLTDNARAQACKTTPSAVSTQESENEGGPLSHAS